MKVEKARWSSELHGKALNLRWTAGEGFEPEAERDYKAEIIAFLMAKSWRTVKEIAAPKEPKKKGDKPGIGASEDKVEEILEGDPETFLMRTKEEAQAVGRNWNARVWSLRLPQNAHDVDGPKTAFSGVAEESSASASGYKDADDNRRTPDAEGESATDPKRRRAQPGCAEASARAWEKLTRRSFEEIPDEEAA